MKEIHIKRREYNEKDYFKRYAAESDFKTKIEEPCKIYFDNKLAAVLLYDQVVPEETRLSILDLKEWARARRGSGIRTETIAIGYQARSPAQSREHCACARVGFSQPAHYDHLLKLADLGEGLYKEHCPELHSTHTKWLDDNVLPEWRVHGGCFTSGVINKNCSMGYHKDRGNIPCGWSVMYVLKHNMSGANLNVADFDASIFLPDRSVLIFDGKNYMHGVTPMKKSKPDGYRYSVVFYAMSKMQMCLPFKEELRRAQIMRDEREMRRAGLIK